uniref:Uncharacterized protein n=1 Tax=Mycena chlorophos TaxID=658473 RepID=A0ABQ0LDH6_MYCCL|nr:predicted protein [Mycena chlorophos]
MDLSVVKSCRLVVTRLIIRFFSCSLKVPPPSDSALCAINCLRPRLQERAVREPNHCHCLTMAPLESLLGVSGQDKENDPPARQLCAERAAEPKVKTSTGAIQSVEDFVHLEPEQVDAFLEQNNWEPRPVTFIFDPEESWSNASACEACRQSGRYDHALDFAYVGVEGHTVFLSELDPEAPASVCDQTPVVANIWEPWSGLGQLIGNGVGRDRKPLPKRRKKDSVSRALE